METIKYIDISCMVYDEIINSFSTLSNGDKVFLSGKTLWNASEPIKISASDLHIEAYNAEIQIEQTSECAQDSAFVIDANCNNVCIDGLYVKYNSVGDNTQKSFAILKNSGKNTVIKNCTFDVTIHHQQNITVIFNQCGENRKTQGENLQTCNNRIYVYQKPLSFTVPSTSYGIYNTGAGFCCKNNYLFIQNDGVGEQQRAVGIYNSGDGSLMDNNNIKGNGTHNVGTLVNKCHAYGAVDDSNNSTWCNNNIVGEWGGFCCGIKCNGKDIKVCHNKILATHTIKGRTVLVYGDCCEVYSNIVTSTSRNPRLIEINGRHCRVYENLLDAVLGTWDVYISACGIYVNKAEDCRISDNAIMVLKDCGIFCNECDAKIVNNNILDNIYNADYCNISNNDNEVLANLLDERNITDYIPTNS